MLRQFGTHVLKIEPDRLRKSAMLAIFGWRTLEQRRADVSFIKSPIKWSQWLSQITSSQALMRLGMAILRLSHTAKGYSPFGICAVERAPKRCCKLAKHWHIQGCSWQASTLQKKGKKKSRECHKPQPFPDTKRKRKPTNPNKHKSNKRTKSTKISSLFPKRGNRNTKSTEKHKNKITHGKTYNKSPRRVNHKATKRKTNTGTTAFERSVE